MSQTTNIELIASTQSSFPPLLRNIYQAPTTLWYRGNLKLASQDNLLSVVGSRQASWYGSLATQNILTPTLLKQLVVVSGLAIGIDTLAHRAALAADSPTIAILGSGLDDASLYPASNWQLASQIVSSGGLLLSEYPPNELARPYYFPQRNRIIAGLSRATLVIEAAEKSGALLTARLALQEGRDVLAVPGNINQTLSVGTNQLIQSGAQPILSSSDLAKALDLPLANSYSEASLLLTIEQVNILETLNKPLNIDQLIRATGWPMSQLTDQLTELELVGLIKLQADNTYVACSSKKLCV